MKDGLSLTRMVVFFSALAGGERRGERRVVGLLALDDLEQRHDGDRVEEVEPDDPLGVLQVRAISVIDSDEVLVARTHSGADDRLDLGPDLLLDRHLLEDRLDDEVGVGEAVLGRRAGDQALEPVGLVGARPGVLPSSLSTSPWT